MPKQQRPSFESSEFRALVEVAGRAISTAIEDAGVVDHHATSGSIREDGFRDFLSKMLPGKYSIATGFAFDARDNVSKQLDIMISIQPPFGGVFQQHGLCRLPCEVVLAVIEVKKVLRIDELRQTLENAASVRSLSPYGNQRFVPSRSMGDHSQTRDHRCFYNVVALTSDLGTSDWASAEIQRLHSVVRSSESDVDLLDRIVILDRGVINVGANKSQSNSDRREAVIFEWFLHLVNHLDREARRRRPLDFDIYAGGRNKWNEISVT